MTLSCQTFVSLAHHADADDDTAFFLSNLEINAFLLKFTVVLTATSPAFFRGFTLIALKDGREGTAYGDYAGQFQVSAWNTNEFILNALCCDRLIAVQTAEQGQGRDLCMLDLFWNYFYLIY